MAERANLEDLRKQMLEITLEITRLCGERLLLAKKIGEMKTKMNLPLEDARVEQLLRNRALEACKRYGIGKSFCLNLLELLLKESKHVQREALRSKS